MPEGCYRHIHRCENLKSHVASLLDLLNISNIFMIYCGFQCQSFTDLYLCLSAVWIKTILIMLESEGHMSCHLYSL